MTDPGTIVLASDDGGLAESLRPHVGDMDVIRATQPRTVASVGHGELRCFIDWALRDLSGLEVCRRFRAEPATASAHITLVLEDLDSGTRSRALKAGADDYALGPLTAELVLDRLHRHSSAPRTGPHTERLRAGLLELDPGAHRVWFQGAPVPLQPRQFALLSFLMQHPDRVHARGELLKLLGRGGPHEDERTVDAWVARLRRDLRGSGAPDPVRTVRDYGYVLDSA